MWKHLSCPNSLERPLGYIFIPEMSYMLDTSLQIWFVSLVSYHIHHCCHRARESSPSVSLSPKCLFLFHGSYSSTPIRPELIHSKYIYLPTHPNTLFLLMESKWQEEDAMWHRKSSLCGSHILHVSSWSIATLIFPCIYLFISFIKYLFHSNVQTSFIVPLIPNPKASTPNLGS